MLLDCITAKKNEAEQAATARIDKTRRGSS